MGNDEVAGGIRVLPVTRETWADFAALFEERGSPHYCWCMIHRARGDLSPAERRQAMHDIVFAGTPVGVLAYDGEKPVGWCSVAPRESYVRLERSRTMPRVSGDGTWTILCFFVRRSYRRRGLTEALLRGGVAYARQQGARVVEGYPSDTAGIVSTHRGHSKVFAGAGFGQEGRRWSLDVEAVR